MDGCRRCQEWELGIGFGREAPSEAGFIVRSLLIIHVIVGVFTVKLRK